MLENEGTDQKRSVARRDHYVRAQKVRFGLALAFFCASLTIYILHVHIHSMYLKR